MTVVIQQLMRRVGELYDSFHRAVHEAHDADAALALVTDDCVVEHLPVGTGAGRPELRRFLGDDLIGHLPADLAFRRTSRVLDQRRLVEETVVSFVHDRPLPWLLPGVEPTGRSAEVHAITVASFAHASRLGETTTLISGLRTHWDLFTLLVQLGIAVDDVRPVGTTS
ncbi:hypothetical protein WIS52_16850 [Pseudonocardia nematodicida]|uniref:SnoaL-like domain-containing protein n=1 Tax=Pseudonocardia nematodicida TaxID=1206997 RepID=A0ABV1KCE6_9PSEU